MLALSSLVAAVDLRRPGVGRVRLPHADAQPALIGIHDDTERRRDRSDGIDRSG